MACNWIIQDVIFRERLSEMETLLQQQGHGVHVLKDVTSLTDLNIPFSSTDPVISMVSLTVARKIARLPNLVPGVFYRPDIFRMSHYAAYWGEFLLNDDFICLPWAEFIRRRDYWNELYGHRGGIFVRPDAGEKTFTGLTIPFPDWNYEIRCLEALSGVTPETMVCVSSPKLDLQGEWRFWIVNGIPVSHSHYSWRDNDESKPPPVSCIRLINDLCHHSWQPDVAYTADVCMTEGGARLIEINSFSCSGVYQAELLPIIEAATSAATDEWCQLMQNGPQGHAFG